jgi:hypothetical protein
MVFNCEAKQRVNAIESRLKGKARVFGTAHAARKFISNKVHLNQHIAEYSYMMRPTPKVKGD